MVLTTDQRGLEKVLPNQVRIETVFLPLIVLRRVLKTWNAADGLD